MKIDKYLMFTN